MEQNIIQFDTNLQAIDFTITRAKEITIKQKQDLLTLLNSHYKTMTLNDVFGDQEYLENLFVLQFTHNNKVIASRQIYFVPFIKMAPLWAQNIARQANIKHFAIGSRAIVDPNYQNLQLGRRLIEKGNQYAFDTLKVEHVFGSSTSIGAMSLYLRLGAYMWKPSLSASLSKSKNQAVSFFKYLTTTKEYRLLRLDKPISYIYFNKVFDAHLRPLLYQNPKLKYLSLS